MEATIRECEKCGYQSFMCHNEEKIHKHCGGLMKIVAREKINSGGKKMENGKSFFKKLSDLFWYNKVALAIYKICEPVDAPVDFRPNERTI